MTDPTKPPEISGADAEAERTREELEIENLKRSNIKLALEADKLSKDVRVSPAMPLYISAISAIVAAIGLMLSTSSQLYQFKYQNEQAAYKEKLDRDTAPSAAAAVATDNHAAVDRRISGIYELGRFFDFADQEQVTAATLTTVLAVGDMDAHARLQCSAAEVIGSAIRVPVSRLG